MVAAEPSIVHTPVTKAASKNVNFEHESLLHGGGGGSGGNRQAILVKDRQWARWFAGDHDDCLQLCNHLVI